MQSFTISLCSYFYKIRLAVQSCAYTGDGGCDEQLQNPFVPKAVSLISCSPPHYNFPVNKNICLSHSSFRKESHSCRQYIYESINICVIGLPFSLERHG